jgi:hypothetical protein
MSHTTTSNTICKKKLILINPTKEETHFFNHHNRRLSAHNSDNEESQINDNNKDLGPSYPSSKPAADNTVTAVKHNYNGKCKIEETDCSVDSTAITRMAVIILTSMYFWKHPSEIQK